MENNKKFLLGLIIGILSGGLLIGGATYYLVSDKYNDNNQINEEDNKEQENNQQAPDKLPVTDDEIKPLDLTKCINNSSLVYEKPQGEELVSNGLSLEINPDKKSAQLHIDWRKYDPDVVSSNENAEWSTSVPILEFNKAIKKGFIGGAGQSKESVILFYLMEDGTVEYTRLYKQSKDKEGYTYYEMNYSYNYTAEGKADSQAHFKTKGSIPGVTDVIDLYNVFANVPNGVGGHVTTIGVKRDGSFYDLGDIINK